MSDYALIKDGLVDNIVVWDGKGDLFSDYQVVELNDGTIAAPGWSYDGKSFAAPAEPEKSHGELMAEAEQQKEYLLNNATSRIVVWQTKLLAGRTLSAPEKEQLNAWLDYIDALDAIDMSAAPDITWPEKPEQ